MCLQHEMDHLQGKLFVDYLSPLKRQMVRKKLEKARKLAIKDRCRRRGLTGPSARCATRPVRLVFAGTPEFAVPPWPA